MRLFAYFGYPDMFDAQSDVAPKASHEMNYSSLSDVRIA